jgi:hypothetical protein
MRITHELLTAYNLLENMDVLVRLSCARCITVY